MKHIHIDCTNIRSIQELHSHLAEALAFPQWYGHNLDALHDCLPAITEDTQIVFDDISALPFPSMGLTRVLLESEAENPRLQIIL